MPQIDRQLRQQVLHIGPLAIPGRQPMNGEGVTQVVQARLVACAVIASDAGVLTKASEVALYRVLAHSGAIAHGEEVARLLTSGSGRGTA